MRTSSVDQFILDTLSHEHVHLTSSQVYEDIKLKLPAVNPSTVYRALERLAKQGKISISDMGTGAAVYETVADGMHHHLVCQKCGQVITIGHAEVEHFFSVIQGAHHFQINTNHLILFGLCEICQKSEISNETGDRSSN